MRGRIVVSSADLSVMTAMWSSSWGRWCGDGTSLCAVRRLVAPVDTGVISGASSGGGFAVRQRPAGPREVAVVAARVPLQIVLVLGLGDPEWDGFADLGHDPAGPQA